jgi:tetratricopeptide (TPR) repeat protein
MLYRTAPWRHAVVGILTALVLSVTIPSAFAQNDGIADLDEAMVKKIDANTPQQLEEVAVLVESAIAKGLDEENTSFAKKMLGGISLQQAQGIIGQLLRGGQNRNVPQMRKQAMELLEKAVASDATLVEGHIMIAQLNAIPGGDPQRALDAATAAIEQLAGEPVKQSEAYLLRSALRTTSEDRLADLNAAIEADAESSKALQARALYRLESGELEGAVEDLKALLGKDPNNTNAAVALSQTLVQLDRAEDAVELLNTAITNQPSAALYLLRAEIRRLQEKVTEAIADLDRAISMDGKNPAAYLLRGELKLREDKVDEAKVDIDQSMTLQPTPQGLFLRSLIAADQKRYTDAINDIKLLARNDPTNDAWALQLANYYQMDDRPRKAIEIANEIIQRDPAQWQALRLRGDAYLSISKHAEAIADYREALKQPLAEPTKDGETADPNAMTKASRSGLANNLAWVLSTSPTDDVRNGDEAIKYGNEAAELTEFKEAHILSTLAAAYAEAGDFEKAKEWANKAVEVGEADNHEQIEQLRNELKSYEAGKPWREQQDVKENAVPILAPEDTIDT